MIFSASQACYALFSECDPHTPAWSSFTSRSPLLLLLLSGRKPQLIKTFILFPILLSQCHAGPLAISVIDISACLRQCVCARTLFCVCVNMEGAPGKVCRLPLKRGALPAPPSITLLRSHTPLSNGLWCFSVRLRAGSNLLQGSWQTLWGSRMFLFVQTTAARRGWCVFFFWFYL